MHKWLKFYLLIYWIIKWLKQKILLNQEHIFRNGRIRNIQWKLTSFRILSKQKSHFNVYFKLNIKIKLTFYYIRQFFYFPFTKLKYTYNNSRSRKICFLIQNCNISWILNPTKKTSFPAYKYIDINASLIIANEMTQIPI